MADPSFLYATCQPGAESALKVELAQKHPEWRFAFSRPGFVTFKWVGQGEPTDRPQLNSVFAITYGNSLGPVRGETEEERIADALARLAPLKIQHLHLWQRPPRVPSSRLPVVTTAESQRVAEGLLGAWSMREGVSTPPPLNQVAAQGQLVANCVLLEPTQWWLGWHWVTTFGQRWVGGVPQIPEPERMISRAYLKMEEALLWSELPVRPGDRCIDLGSAPGGAAQSLLERGLHVLGVDPAEMAPEVLAHPNFTHLRKRGADVRRILYRDYRWLMADANVAPKHTLDTVESIVTHPGCRIQGMVLTLKLSDWSVAEQLDSDARRVRSWGFPSVHIRQLACNHQEVCLVAVRGSGRSSKQGRHHAARK